MKDFNFHIPTKLYFGKDKELEVGTILSFFGAKKVLIVYGQGSIVKSGLLATVQDLLQKEGIEYIELKGVMPNPDVSKVKEGLALIKAQPVDFILAIGGGSVIDTAKLISAAYFYDGDPYDISLKKVQATDRIPVGVILTISAAGSEMSTSAVISNNETKTKTGYNSELNRPIFAIENPELSYTVSPYQSAVGVVDILAHTLERYFNPSSENELSDALAEGLMKSVIEAGKVVIENPNDYNARATLMLGSTLSHNGLMSLGKDAYMPIHQFEHVISGFYPEVAHGAGLAVMIPAWMEFYRKIEPKKFAKFARNVFNYDSGNDLDSGRYATVTLKSYFKNLGLPVSLDEYGIYKSDLEKLAARLTSDGEKPLPHHIHPVDYETALKIFELALEE